MMMQKIYQLIIFDADKTLRYCTENGQPCPNRAGEWEFMPNVLNVMARYNWKKTKIGIASNQAGVHFGFLTRRTAYDLIEDMLLRATATHPPSHAIQICPHDPRIGCLCRKPAPGMLEDLMRLYDVLPTQTLFVGDMESDEQAAIAACCDFQYASEFFA